MTEGIVCGGASVLACCNGTGCFDPIEMGRVKGKKGGGIISR